ncbi:hypothetical protein DDZ13_02830 [Coraliomargarita sinensis]|uniref:Protein BatD n=1 Tax=Coraliomargarita sinensis TaxID=2174842 RepID=A0A317ZH99_9BACT|nr:BatD family protein [Coraliomargarita sinensis]PXA04916.1 hypothetical protein DDZ13_02830 [Coraliomargarita sinensis]
MRLLSIFTIILATFPAALLAEIQVTARFNPPRIALGDRTQYVIEVSETSDRSQPEVERITSLPIPESNKLELRNGRTSKSQQTRIVNGAAEYSVTQSLIIDASAPGVGDFTIPAYTFEYKGQRLRVPAATLKVLERSADAGPSRDELIFLKADLPEKLYVGQMVALDLKLYVGEEAQLRGLNSFDRSADGFTISELPEDYREGVEMVKGRRYRTLTWPLTLTPIQTGEQALSFQFALTARLPGQNNNRDRFGRSPLGSSLFDDFFGRSERINVYTDALSIDVLPLPEEGQPESFSGAIGDIAMEVGTDSDTTAQGEPIMLSVVLKGSGNFERITGPSFADSDDWKHYDPETQFEPADSLGLTGSQRFDYVFVPQRPGKLSIPETRFSYFDPEQEEYVELTAPPIPVEVSPAKNNFSPTPPPPTRGTPEPDLQLSKALSSEEALLTLDYRPKEPRPVGYGILRSPVFIGLNILAGLLIAAGATLLYRNRRHRQDPRYALRAEAKQALKAARQGYLEALRADDAETFYKQGELAVRHAATVKTGRSMQSAESAQIEALLSGQAAEDCRAFFETANAHRFGGNAEKAYTDAQQQIERILKAL